MYRAYWNDDGCVDAEEFTSLNEAKERTLEIYEEFMEESYDLTVDEWNEMIEEIIICVEKYNPVDDEWYTAWTPSKKKLKEIGWVKKTYPKLTINKFIKALRHPFEDEDWMISDLGICLDDIQTFEDAAVLTNDKGLVFQFEDGTKFYVTVQGYDKNGVCL